MTDMVLYEQLASLVDYPNAETPSQVEACWGALKETVPGAAELLEGMRDHLQRNAVIGAEELFTQTFDVSPVCTMDLSYYLFGEDYQRGVFLAQLREHQEEAGMSVLTELPDHLPVVLRWLARVEDSEVQTDMLTDCVLPGLWRMVDSLGDGSNPYRGVLQAIALALEHDLQEKGIVIPKTAGQPLDNGRSEFQSSHAHSIPGQSCRAPFLASEGEDQR